MGSKDTICPIQTSFPDKGACPLADFLSRLKKETDFTGEFMPSLLQQLHRMQQYRCMGIMAARMCIPEIHTAIAFVQQILHGQSVHIRTQNKNLSTSFFSAYAGKNPGFSDSAVCNANPRQLLLYFCGCLIFLHAWLRMHMKPAAKCNQRLLLFFYPRIYLHTCLL